MAEAGATGKPIRIVPASDPFLRKWLQSGTRITAAAWTAEAFRRYVAFRQPGRFPYFAGEPTWFWSRALLEEVLGCEGDVPRARLDPEGPGYGVHVFESPHTPASLAVMRERRAIRGHAVQIDDDRPAFTYLLRIAADGACTGLSPNNAAEVTGSAAVRFADHPVYSRLAVKLQAVLRAKAVVFTPGQAPRHLRRQSKRDLGVDMDTAVRVVTWRKAAPDGRKADGEGAGATVGFHRCRGHFREQWYPSKGRHGAIFIEAHYRGSGPVKGVAARPVVHYVRQ